MLVKVHMGLKTPVIPKMKAFPLALSLLVFLSKFTYSSNAGNDEDGPPSRRRRASRSQSLNVSETEFSSQESIDILNPRRTYRSGRSYTHSSILPVASSTTNIQIQPVPQEPESLSVTATSPQPAPELSLADQQNHLSQDSWAGFPFAQPDPEPEPDSQVIEINLNAEIISEDQEPETFDIMNYLVDSSSNHPIHSYAFTSIRLPRLPQYLVSSSARLEPRSEFFPSLDVLFETADTDMYPFVIENSKLVFSRLHSKLGRVKTPSGEVIVVGIPLNFKPEEPSDSDDDEDETTLGASQNNQEEDPDATQMTQENPPGTPVPVAFVGNVFLTPTGQSIPVHNSPPPHRLPSYQDAQVEDYGNDFHLFPSKNCKCGYAIRRLDIRMTSVSAPAVIHTDFANYSRIFDNNETFYWGAQTNFTTEQLRAFEVNFPVFFRMVARCPSCFFFPSLALALQYDQDFPKFLELYFKIPHEYDQSTMIQSLLNILVFSTIVSEKATVFFSTTSNAAFFFESIELKEQFLGKFPFVPLIENLIKIKEHISANPDPSVDYSKNELRDMFLDFDVLSFIKKRIGLRDFAVDYLFVVLRSIVLFKNVDDYYLSIYTLLQKIGDNYGALALKSRSRYKCDFCELKNQYTHVYLTLLLKHKLPRHLLKLALTICDITMVELLFKYFTLENNDEALSIRNTPNTQQASIETDALFVDLLIVKITLELDKISLILPFGPQ